MKLRVNKKLACAGIFTIVALAAAIAVGPFWPFNPGLMDIHGEFSDSPELVGPEYLNGLETILTSNLEHYIRCGSRIFVNYELWKNQDLISQYSNAAIYRAQEENRDYKPPVTRIFFPAGILGVKRPTNVISINELIDKHTGQTNNAVVTNQ